MDTYYLKRICVERKENGSVLLEKLKNFEVVISNSCESGLRRFRLGKNFQIMPDGNVEFFDIFGVLSVSTYENFCVEDIGSEDKMDVVVCRFFQKRNEVKEKMNILGESEQIVFVINSAYNT